MKTVDEQPFWDKLEKSIIPIRKEIEGRKNKIYDILTNYIPNDIIQYIIIPFESEWTPYDIGFHIERDIYWYYQPYQYQPYKMFPFNAVSKEDIEKHPEQYYPIEYRPHALEKQIFDSKMIVLYLKDFSKEKWFIINEDIGRKEWKEHQNKVKEGWDLFYHQLANCQFDCREYSRWFIWRLYLDGEFERDIQLKYSYRYAIPFMWFKIPSDKIYLVRLELIYNETVLYKSNVYSV